MLPLKAYLLHWQPDEGWNITVHRDLDSLTDACKLVVFEQDHTAIIHIGFWRPDSDAFKEAVERFPGIVLVTSSAKDALPQPVATTGKPVCEVQGLGLFPVLSGWGYETSEAELGVATEWQRQLSFLGAPLPTVPIPLPFELTESSNWVSRLALENAEAYQAAMAFGINNDDSLFLNETAIPDKLRSFLNVYRFHFITGEFPSASNVLDNLYLAGPSLLKAPLSNFELSTRATNVFTKSNIQYVSEIAEYKTQGLYNLKNMGKGTVRELAYLMMLCWFPGFGQDPNKINDGCHLTSYQPNPVAESDGLGPSEEHPCDVFISQLELALNQLSANRQWILRSRMGFKGDTKTLEDLGNELGISRERVRQIETAGILFLKRNVLFKNQLAPRLLKLVENRESALPLFGLEIIDPWFAGVAEDPDVFKWILEHCCECGVSVIYHIGQNYLSKIQQNEWDSLIASTLNLMKAQVGSRISRSQARTLVTGMLVGHGDDLREVLWEAVLQNLNFSGIDGEDDILVNVGNNLTAIVEAVLVEASTPLHLTEISSRVQERSGRFVEGNQLRKILVEISFLFGRGTYGLRSHLDLTNEELDLVRMEIEGLIVTNNCRRQWHASEIYASLAEAFPELYSKITPHVIGIALKNSDQLVSLGRMVWTAKQAVGNSSSSRIDIHQAIVSLLRNEGRPMTMMEIRQGLLRDRGLNSIFQIVMEGPLIRVGRGVWGLADRDIPYSEHEQERIVDSLVLLLSRRQRGIHYSVLVTELSKYLPNLDLSVDPSLYLSIAQRSGSMKVDMGQYLYLPEWGESRWPSNTEVVSNILARNPGGGWTLAELLSFAEEKLERPLEPGFIHRAIECLGGTYDPDAKKWYFPAEVGAGVQDED